MTLSAKLISKPIIIAIDGLSSCGKSTLAKDLAQQLNYTYIDTGAMYRAVTWYMLENRLDPSALISHLPNLKLRFQYENGENHLFLNEKDITKEIRSKEVNDHVSQVSTLEEVRNYLVAMQQEMGQSKGIVMDGRDIGTVVFPEAEVKLYLTASPDIRADRRYKEYQDRGVEIPYKDVLDNLTFRDHTDSNRKISPLKKASDAHIIDTSHLTREEQLEQALRIVHDYKDKLI